MNSFNSIQSPRSIPSPREKARVRASLKRTTLTFILSLLGRERIKKFRSLRVLTP